MSNRTARKARFAAKQRRQRPLLRQARVMLRALGVPLKMAFDVSAAYSSARLALAASWGRPSRVDPLQITGFVPIPMSDAQRAFLVLGDFATLAQEDDPEDIFMWPCGTTCFRFEAAEFTHKSDDYEVIRYGTSQWLDMIAL